MKKIFMFLLALAIVFGLSVQAHATLTTIGTASYDSDGNGTPESYNLIYDNDSPFGSIIWLDYQNAVNTWQNQVNWAAGLNSGGVLTYNLNSGVAISWSGDWRLPSTVDGVLIDGYDGTTTGGYNITSSEMGHLFYEGLGNTGEYDTSGIETGCSIFYPRCLTETGYFENLHPIFYWSGTEYSASPDSAWGFLFHSGRQVVGYTGHDFCALAVRPGDVAAVPEPATVLLLGSGLIGVGLLRRRFKN